MLNQRQLKAVESLKPNKESLRPVFERLKAQQANTEILYEKLEQKRAQQPNVTVEKLEKQIEKYKKSLRDKNPSESHISCLTDRCSQEMIHIFFTEKRIRNIRILTDRCNQEMLRIGCIVPKEPNFYIGSTVFEDSDRPFHQSYMVFGLGLSPWLESLVPIDNLYFVMYGAMKFPNWDITTVHNVLVDDVSKVHNLRALYNLSEEQAKETVAGMSNMKLSSLILSYSSHAGQHPISVLINPISFFHNTSGFLFKSFRGELSALYDSNKEFRALILNAIPKRLKEKVGNNPEKIRILADYPLDEVALSFALLMPISDLASNPKHEMLRFVAQSLPYHNSAQFSQPNTGVSLPHLDVAFPPTKLGPLSECAYDDLFLKVIKKELLPWRFSFWFHKRSMFNSAISSRLFHHLPGAPSSSNVASIEPYIITKPYDRVLITDTTEDIAAKAELYHRNSGMKKRLVFENFLLATYDLVRREYTRKPYPEIYGNEAKLIYPNSDDRKTVFIHDSSWDVDRSNFYQQFHDKVLKPIQDVLRALFEGE